MSGSVSFSSKRAFRAPAGWAKPSSKTAHPERLHALDAVRGFALLLGIVQHATVSFISEPTRISIIEDSHLSMTLAVLYCTIHVFRITTFFLIACFFGRLSSHRRGNRDFIKHPPVLGWPIFLAAVER